MTQAQTAADRTLLDAARAGDEAALEELLRRHQARIYRFGVKMCRDPEDASDVLQDTLLAMARGIRDFRGASSLSTWLYAITRSFCVKKRRRSRFAPAAEESLEGMPDAERDRLADPRRGPDDDLAGLEVRRALDRAIRSLAPMYREVLLLRDVEGLSAAEAAEVLQLGVDAVKSRLHRARLAVREALGPVMGMPLPESAAGCPDVLGKFSRHLEGEIGADLCARMEAHLQECSRCRSACDTLKQTLALCREAATPAVPADVQDAVRVAIRSFLSGPEGGPGKGSARGR